MPPVTSVTSGSGAAPILLYLNGTFNPNAQNTVNWNDPTTGITSLNIVSTNFTQMIAQVPAALFATPVSNPVPVTISVLEQGFGGPPTPAIFTINPPLSSNGPNLPIGTVGQPYSGLAIRFGTPAYQITSSTVPAGLNLVSDPSGVLLTGVPTTAGIFTLQPTVTDFWGRTIAPSLTVHIVANAILTSASPASAAPGSPDLAVTLNGSGFEAANAAIQSLGSTAFWTMNSIQTELMTTFVSGNQLQVLVPAALLANAGTATISILQPNDVFSNGIAFNIQAPAISGLAPGSIAAGSAAFPLAITGSSFLAGSTVTFGGTPLTTSFVNTGRLNATVPANLVKNSGSFPVVVSNPGGISSAPATFFVNPAITGLSPSSVLAGSPAFPLSITGATFTAASTVSFNGVNLTATFVNTGLVSVTVPANLVTAAGTFPVVVTNPGVGASAPALFTVTQSLSIVTASLGSATAGSFYSVALAGKGGTLPYTWSASGLPPALGITAATGLISGNLQQAGTFVIGVTLKDSAGASVSAQYSLVVGAPPVSISTGPLPNGTVGVPYIGTVGASGGTGPYTYSLGGGPLPDGLTLSAGGSITGTPKTPGTFSFSVTATDSTGASGGRGYTVTIAPAPLVVTGGPTPGITGTPISIPFSGGGGVGPYQCTASGTLPPGTTFANCTLSGTPTTPGTFTFQVIIKDSTGVTATRDVTVVIAPAGLNLTGTVGNGQVGVAYSGQLTAAGGTPPYTFTAAGLPDGVTVSALGVISGKPTTAGPYSIVGSVADAAGAKGNGNLRSRDRPAGPHPDDYQPA